MIEGVWGLNLSSRTMGPPGLMQLSKKILATSMTTNHEVSFVLKVNT